MEGMESQPLKAAVKRQRWGRRWRCHHHLKLWSHVPIRGLTGSGATGNMFPFLTCGSGGSSWNWRCTDVRSPIQIRLSGCIWGFLEADALTRPFFWLSGRGALDWTTGHLGVVDCVWVVWAPGPSFSLWWSCSGDMLGCLGVLRDLFSGGGPGNPLAACASATLIGLWARGCGVHVSLFTLSDIMEHSSKHTLTWTHLVTHLCTKRLYTSDYWNICVC